MKKGNFLLEDYLKSINIDYKISGKNIGEGWIGLRECPFCNDNRYHFGVNIERGNFSCWVCKTSGNIIKLIQTLENTSYNEAYHIYKNFTINFFENKETLKDKLNQIFNLSKNNMEEKEKINKKEIKLPENIIPLSLALKKFKVVKNFLSLRGYTEEDINTWGETFFCLDGKLVGRIIFPIYLYNQLVNYVGRTVLNNPLRYYFCPNHEAVVSIKNCIYNYDNWEEKEDIIITEGIFDALKTQKLLNKKAIALFGKQISISQIFLIKKKNPKNIYLFLDKDAWEQSLIIKNRIQEIIKSNIKIIIPKLKDPDSYINKEDMIKLFKEIENG